MTQDDILRMAREAGLYLPYWQDDQDPKKDPPQWVATSPLPPLIERFAALVAAKEREACAQVCVEISKDYWMGDAQFEAATRCLNAIRQRGRR